MDYTFYRKVARTAGIIVASIGAVVLVGWVYRSPFLTAIHPDFATMKPNTALGFLVLGLALFLLQYSQRRVPLRRTVALALAATGLVIGVLSTAEYLFHWNLQIDQLLYTADSIEVRTSHPGRMAPLTACLFLLTGSALSWLKGRVGLWVGQVVCIITLLFSSLSLLGYAFGASWFNGAGAYATMAVHTSLCFFILSAGILYLVPGRGVAATLQSSSVGGVVIRGLLPAAIVVPVAVAWLRAYGERVGVYGSEVGIVLQTATTIGLLVVLIMWSARYLNRLDRRRHNAENDLSHFFTLSLDLFCVAGVDGRFKRLNPVWTQRLGYSVEELTRPRFIEFIHPVDRVATEEAMSKLAAGTDVLTFRNRCTRKGGGHIWLEWMFRAPTGDSQHIHAVARDITEQRRLERRMQQLNRDLEANIAAKEASNAELEAFSYSVSHDLRAPLRAIEGFSRILMEDHTESLDEDGRRLLNIVCDNTEKMGRLIDDLLEFSRTARRPVQRMQIDMNELVQGMVAELRAMHADRVLDVRVGDLPPAWGDRSLLTVVWTNLLSNAVKYTQGRATAVIEIAGRTQAGEVVYTVKDNGVGFDRQYAGKLFGVFQRLHGEQEFAGTGVGLALAQRIVLRHEGRIWGDGELDQGATFGFALPQQGAADGVITEGSGGVVGGGQSVRRGADDPRAEEEQPHEQTAPC